ncbi:hypothetical protein ABC733_07180 [Mangrovibacter sp. SLW1]
MADAVADYAYVHTLGEFISTTRYSDFPPHIVEKAKRHFLDTLGLCLQEQTVTFGASARP